MSNTETIDTKLREKARMELQKEIDQAIGEIRKLMGPCNHKTSLVAMETPFNTRELAPGSDSQKVYKSNTLLKELSDIIFKAHKEQREQREINAFMRKVDSLQDQVDELRNQVDR